MDAFQLGPFIIKYSLLFTVVSGVASYTVIKKMFMDSPDFREKFLDELLNSFIIGVLSYKVSILLFRPELLTRNPLGALYLSGGWKEWLTAIILAGLYLYWKYKKHRWHLALIGKAILSGIIAFITTFWLLRTLFFLFV